MRVTFLERLFRRHPACESQELCEERQLLKERQERLRELQQEEILDEELRYHKREHHEH